VGLNYLVSTRQYGPWDLLVLGCGLPGAMATAAGMGEPSLQAAGVLGPAVQMWAPGGQCSSTAGMWEPRLCVYLLAQATRSHGSWCWLEGTKPFGHKSSGAWFPTWASGSTDQWCCCWFRGAKSAGLWLLLPVELWEPCILLTQRHWFTWCFMVKVAGHVIGESVEPQVRVCAGKQDLLLSTLSNGG
jgi:hypothetical protein